MNKIYRGISGCSFSLYFLSDPVFVCICRLYICVLLVNHICSEVTDKTLHQPALPAVMEGSHHTHVMMMMMMMMIVVMMVMMVMMMMMMMVMMMMTVVVM